MPDISKIKVRCDQCGKFRCTDAESLAKLFRRSVDEVKKMEVTTRICETCRSRLEMTHNHEEKIVVVLKAHECVTYQTQIFVD